MAEPQIPGTLSGMPSEGNPAPVQRDGGPGYAEGPTYSTAPYAPAGNPNANPVVPTQRPSRAVAEWRW